MIREEIVFRDMHAKSSQNSQATAHNQAKHRAREREHTQATSNDADVRVRTGYDPLWEGEPGPIQTTMTSDTPANSADSKNSQKKSGRESGRAGRKVFTKPGGKAGSKSGGTHSGYPGDSRGRKGKGMPAYHSGQSGQAVPRRTIEFQDNRIAALVYGQHDRHLTRIESQLGVVLINRGNRVSIEGRAETTALALKVLEDLYAMAEKGRVLDVGDVDGAIRMNEDHPHPAGRSGLGVSIDRSGETIEITTRNKVIKPRSKGQADYMAKLASEDIVFGVGPAGTGKTYLAVAMAVARMLAGEVDRIILSRPAVEAGENLGFLPGDLKEKVDPYLRPLYDALYDMMPADQVEKRLASGQIEIAPLAYMRGRTLAHSAIILDEAQNTTPMQMKMILTRFGENSRMVICGDPTQIDLGPTVKSGLIDALDTLRGVEGIAVTRFSFHDVVRHPLVARIVDAYEKDAEKKAGDRKSAVRAAYRGSKTAPEQVATADTSADTSNIDGADTPAQQREG